MRILIAGIDGYLGWSLARYLTKRGHTVGGVDLFLRRQWVEEMGSWSAIPIASMRERLAALKEHSHKELLFWEGDLRDYSFVEATVRRFEPDAIVHFGECPSAPYSMIDVHHATFVQTNNIVGTFNLLFAIRDHRPEAHLLKLGTMGEYGTPNLDIPEGFFDIEYNGRRDRLPFPRQAGSWYHWSKVHGSNNIMFACGLWNLRATDVMQGVVFGTRISDDRVDDRLWSRLDFDQAFGTAINRFCCQAVIGHMLTAYGTGGQKRSFLPLRDSVHCLTLALENPPRAGEYRVFNQFEEVYDILGLAYKVQKVAGELGMDVRVANFENPRREQQEHYYRPAREHLLKLGYRPQQTVEQEVRVMLGDLLKYRDRIKTRENVLIPDVQWVGKRKKVRLMEVVEPAAKSA